jgi:hypothetical protein
MARVVTGTARLKIDVTQASTGVGLNKTATLTHPVLFERTCATGTSNGELDRVYASQLSLTTSPTDLDLAGSLADPLNAAVTVVFADIQWLCIRNTATAGNVVVGGDAADFGVDDPGIPPGGCLFIDSGTAGRAVTGASNDVLQLAASAGTVTCDVLVAGRSA